MDKGYKILNGEKKQKICLPSKLINEIENVLKKDSNFSSKSQFIESAVRLFLEHLGKK